MNTDNKPDPLAGYGSSRMDAAETQVETPLPAGTYCELSDDTSVNQPVGCMTTNQD